MGPKRPARQAGRRLATGRRGTRGQVSGRSDGPFAQRGLHLAREALAEDCGVEAVCVLDACRGVHRCGVECRDRLGELLRAALPEPPGHSVDHVLEEAAGGTRDHGASGRLRLHSRNPELLAGGHHERAARGEQPGGLVVVHAPGEADRGSRDPPQPAPVGAAAGHDERQLQVIERLDRHVDLLVRHELGEHQVVVTHRLLLEALSGHRRVDDARVAPEVGLDARLGGARVGHVAVHPLGGDPVPLAPAPEQASQRGPRDRVGALGERAVTLVPGVAEGVVAVRDMHGPLVADHGVRPGARARDHHVVTRQVERLDRGRVERQKGAEVARRGAHPLKERGVDVAVREAGLRAALVVYGREHIGLRPEVAHLQENAVRTPHTDQKIVNQCRAWLGPPCRATNAHGPQSMQAGHRR